MSGYVRQAWATQTGIQIRLTVSGLLLPVDYADLAEIAKAIETYVANRAAADPDPAATS
jgi:hypothetical protein